MVKYFLKKELAALRGAGAYRVELPTDHPLINRTMKVAVISPEDLNKLLDMVEHQANKITEKNIKIRRLENLLKACEEELGDSGEKKWERVY